MNEFIKASIKISEKHAEVTIPIREDFYHAAKAVHGSIYFKALDDATFFASNSVVEGVLVLTTNFNIYITRPVISGNITAVANLVYQNRSQLILCIFQFFLKSLDIFRHSLY